MARILIVDDDRDVISLLEYLLVKEGFQVLEAVDGKEGYERAVSEKPDLIVLDIMMPELDGLTVAQHLWVNPATKTIPVIVLTAKTRLEQSLEALQNVHRYVTKPFETAYLMDIIRRCLPQQAPEAGHQV